MHILSRRQRKWHTHPSSPIPTSSSSFSIPRRWYHALRVTAGNKWKIPNQFERQRHAISRRGEGRDWAKDRDASKLTVWLPGIWIRMWANDTFFALALVVVVLIIITVSQCMAGVKMRDADFPFGGVLADRIRVASHCPASGWTPGVAGDWCLYQHVSVCFANWINRFQDQGLAAYSPVIHHERHGTMHGISHFVHFSYSLPHCCRRSCVTAGAAAAAKPPDRNHLSSTLLPWILPPECSSGKLLWLMKENENAFRSYADSHIIRSPVNETMSGDGSGVLPRKRPSDGLRKSRWKKVCATLFCFP